MYGSIHTICVHVYIVRDVCVGAKGIENRNDSRGGLTSTKNERAVNACACARRRVVGHRTRVTGGVAFVHAQRNSVKFVAYRKGLTARRRNAFVRSNDND